jgi:hypothetical protein
MTEPTEPPLTARHPWAAHVLIPTLWTPEQARAVFELLDELREAVWTRYADDIQDLLREEQGHGDDAVATVIAGGHHPGDDHPF